MLVFSCIQGSPLSYTYLLPVAVLLIPEICHCSVPFLLYIPFIVLALSMPGITLFAFQRHSWDLFFSTDIVCLLHLSFLAMSAILKSVVFIKGITMKMPRKHTLSTLSPAAFNHLILFCWSVLSLIYIINIMAGPCIKLLMWKMLSSPYVWCIYNNTKVAWWYKNERGVL